MNRVNIRIHEKNRDGLDVEVPYLAGKLFKRWDIQRIDNFTPAAGPLGHFEAQLTRDQGLVTLVMKIKRIRPIAARDF